MKNEILVVGSGVGGATVARELAIRDQEVTILEEGRYHKLGTEKRSAEFYSHTRFARGEKSIEGTEIFRTIMVGGSSMVTLANGVRALQKEMKALGIDLETEFKEAEKELGVAPIPERLMGERTKRLMQASQELGYDVKPMPKFLDFSKCRSCGMCTVGCRNSAKWTAQNFIGEARRAGARLMTETTVDEVLHSNGEIKGVRVHDPSGVFEIDAENVVLAAGGIGTPIILQKSGVNNAGSNLFADLFVNTYGMINEDQMKDEMGMATIIDEFHVEHGFIISPYLDQPWGLLFYLPIFKKLRALVNRKCLVSMRRKTLGLMTKIADDDAGRVDIDGRLDKPVTENDRKKLNKGDRISREILLRAGARPDSFYTTGVQAAHPGGTAGIGRVVNTDHETEISRLFVSDASVVPKAPGAPPVLTIVALSKRFSKKLLLEYI